jgi:hypothetical protein
MCYIVAFFKIGFRMGTHSNPLESKWGIFPQTF